MSADELRRAASLMRGRAEAAGEWNADVAPGDSLHLWVTDYDPSDPTGQTAMQRLVGGADAPWSEHIAAADPPFMLAVADWLDGVALFMEAKADEEYFDLDGDPIAPEDTHAIGSALAVARAYLGADA